MTPLSKLPKGIKNLITRKLDFKKREQEKQLIKEKQSTIVKLNNEALERGIGSIKHFFTENQKHLFEVGVRNYDDLLEIYPLDARMSIEDDLLHNASSEHSSNIRLSKLQGQVCHVRLMR